MPVFLRLIPSYTKIILVKLGKFLHDKGFFDSLKREMVAKNLVPATAKKETVLSKIKTLAKDNPVTFATITGIALTEAGSALIAEFSEEERSTVVNTIAHMPSEDDIIDGEIVEPSSNSSLGLTDVQTIKKTLDDVSELSRILGVHTSQLPRLIELLNTISVKDVKVFEEFYS